MIKGVTFSSFCIIQNLQKSPSLEKQETGRALFCKHMYSEAPLVASSQAASTSRNSQS